MIMTMHNGSRKNAWPTRSMTFRTVLGSELLTMSIRMCSLSSNVHGEHNRKTMLNSTHCSSSQELEEISKLLRMTALRLDTMTASRISQARRLPVQRVNASIARLIFRSDCNDKSSPTVPLPSWPRHRAQRLVQPASMKPPHQTSG